jgi:hypothetical protein
MLYFHQLNRFITASYPRRTATEFILSNVATSVACPWCFCMVGQAVVARPSTGSSSILPTHMWCCSTNVDVDEARQTIH